MSTRGAAGTANGEEGACVSALVESGKEGTRSAAVADDKGARGIVAIEDADKSARGRAVADASEKAARGAVAAKGGEKCARGAKAIEGGEMSASNRSASGARRCRIGGWEHRLPWIAPASLHRAAPAAAATEQRSSACRAMPRSALTAAPAAVTAPPSPRVGSRATHST